MNKSFNYDPYAILQIDRGSTLKEVKIAYKTLARVYHPDKGGHPEMFRMLQEAYKSIAKFIGGESGREANGGPQTAEERKQRLAELMRDHQVTQRGKMSRENFSAERFNQEFESLRNLQEDYIYDVDLAHSDRMNKTFDQLQRERSVMNAEIDQIKPVFNRGSGFDSNVFNRIFENYKKDKGNGGAGMMAGSGGAGMMPGSGGSMVPYDEPQALISPGNMGFSHAMNPHQMAGDLGQGFAPLGPGAGAGGNGVFQNPQEIDQASYQDYGRLPDITQVGSMGRDEMKRRMSEYQSQNFESGRASAGDITGYTLNEIRGANNSFQQDALPVRQIDYQDQYRDQGGNEVEKLREQLSKMERKVKIQDKLIRKIHQEKIGDGRDTRRGNRGDDSRHRRR